MQQCDGECAAAFANEDSEAGAAGSAHAPHVAFLLAMLPSFGCFGYHTGTPLCAAVVLQGPLRPAREINFLNFF